MEQKAKPVPVPPFLMKLLRPGEIVALAVTIAGVALKYLQLNGADEFIMIGLSTLAGVYFLTGFLPPVQTKGDGGNLGFGELFASTILPKVSWIACSVTLIGLLYGLLHLPGSGEMLMIGCSVLSISILASGYFIATGSEQAPALMNILYRSAPICIFGIYMFMNLPPK